MKVSVVIPTLNGGARFCELLEMIFAQRLDHAFEVLCVDSGSTDGSPEFAAKRGARVYSIDRNSFNHGLTRNLGIQKAKGEFIALTVQDALPQDDQWLAALVESIEEDEENAASYSRQIPREDCNPIIKDRLMNWSASRVEREVQSLPEDQKLADLDPMARLKIISFDNVSSCLRRSVWDQIPFSARNFGEDVAWAHSVIQAGYNIVYTPRSAIIHSHNNSVLYEFKRIYSDHQNLNRLIGLTTVPNLRQIFSNGWGAFCHYRMLLNELEKDRLKRCFHIVRALPYAFLENLAQYLGARLHRSVDSKLGIAISLDQWLRHGI